MANSKRHVAVDGRKGIYYSITGAGRMYEVRFRDSDGKDRFKTVGPRLQDAIEAQADIRVRMGRGERVAPNRMTFGDVAAEWDVFRLQSGKLSESTVRKYRSDMANRLLPTFGNLPVQSVDTDMIAVWLRNLRTLRPPSRPLSGSGKLGAYTVLHEVLSYASNPRRGYIPVNPCDALERDELPKTPKMTMRLVSNDEADRLLAACEEWFRPIVQTALLTGMRASEILGLRWKDVDFPNNVIRVEGQLAADGTIVPTKGKERREVPLFPSLRGIILGLPSRFQGGFVFRNSDGGSITYASANWWFRKARVASGVSNQPRPIRLHDCRHTFASVLLRDGKDVTWVSDMLGHKSPTTTLNTYAHVINREYRMEEATVRLAEALGEWAR